MGTHRCVVKEIFSDRTAVVKFADDAPFDELRISLYQLDSNPLRVRRGQEYELDISFTKISDSLDTAVRAFRQKLVQSGSMDLPHTDTIADWLRDLGVEVRR